jgi:hypothetical protein
MNSCKYNPCKGVASSTDIDALTSKIRGDIAQHDAEIKDIDSDPSGKDESGSQMNNVDRMATDTTKQVKFSNRTGDAEIS